MDVVRQERPAHELAQLARVRRGVVHAVDDDVLDHRAPPRFLPVVPQRLREPSQRVRGSRRGGQERRAKILRGGVQRQRQADVRRVVGQFPNRSRNANRRDCYRSLAHVEDSLVRHRPQRDENLLVVVQRLAHPHHHHVAHAGRSAEVARVPNLLAYLARSEVGQQPERARLAKRASHRASNLRRNAHGVPEHLVIRPGYVGILAVAARFVVAAVVHGARVPDDDGLDEFTVVEFDDHLRAAPILRRLGLHHLAGAHREVISQQLHVARGHVRGVLERGFTASEELAVAQPERALLDAAIAREPLDLVDVEERSLRRRRPRAVAGGWPERDARVLAARVDVRPLQQPPREVIVRARRRRGCRLGGGRAERTCSSHVPPGRVISPTHAGARHRCAKQRRGGGHDRGAARRRLRGGRTVSRPPSSDKKRTGKT